MLRKGRTAWTYTMMSAKDNQAWCWMKLCDAYSSWRRWWSHCCWHTMRDSSMLFAQSQWINNSSYITTARNTKSLHAMGSLTTHWRTLKKSLGNSTQLPYSVLGVWEWFTSANNYWRWKFDPFLLFTSQEENQRTWFGKKRNCRENLKMSSLPG